MQQNAFRISYYRDRRAWILSGNSEPQPVCLCCLSVDITSIFRFAFLIILCVYISSSVCAALMLMISPNNLLPTEKKKSIFSKASRLTSANIDGEQTNQCRPVNMLYEAQLWNSSPCSKTRCRIMRHTAPDPTHLLRWCKHLWFELLPEESVPLLWLLVCVCLCVSEFVWACVWVCTFILAHLLHTLSASIQIIITM